MLLTRKVANRLRGLLQVSGSTPIKSRLWDREFSRGRWDFLEETPDDCVYRYIEKYARKGRILDLGCGSGSTGNELDASQYQEYVGVDVSGVAIERARRRTEENLRAPKNRYVQSDIVSYVPAQDFDVILFRDSIYYVSRAHIAAMLHRFSRHLSPGGVFIVRMSNGTEEYRPIADTIEHSFSVVERYVPEQSKTLVVVFR
jgi:SAM-dependent methyltransferase